MSLPHFPAQISAQMSAHVAADFVQACTHLAALTTAQNQHPHPVLYRLACMYIRCEFSDGVSGNHVAGSSIMMSFCRRDTLARILMPEARERSTAYF